MGNAQGVSSCEKALFQSMGITTKHRLKDPDERLFQLVLDVVVSVNGNIMLNSISGSSALS